MAKSKMKVTAIEQWRSLRENGYMVELPSGNVARLRPVSLAEMVKNGRIPDTLTPIAAEVMADGQPSKETILKITNEVTDFLHLVTAASFLEPRVVILKDYDEVPPEGAISIYDVSLEDQSYVLALTGAPTRALESFRQKQETDVALESAGEDDRDKAK
jgi:hypothetical protein